MHMALYDSALCMAVQWPACCMCTEDVVWKQRCSSSSHTLSAMKRNLHKTRLESKPFKDFTRALRHDCNSGSSNSWQGTAFGKRQYHRLAHQKR